MTTLKIGKQIDFFIDFFELKNDWIFNVCLIWSQTSKRCWILNFSKKWKPKSLKKEKKKTEKDHTIPSELWFCPINCHSWEEIIIMFVEKITNFFNKLKFKFIFKSGWKWRSSLMILKMTIEKQKKKIIYLWNYSWKLLK